MNLSTADLRNYWTEFHEIWRSYSQLCGKGGQSHILRGSKGVGVTIESYGKVEISYINVDKFYMDNDRDIQFNIVIGHH